MSGDENLVDVSSLNKDIDIDLSSYLDSITSSDVDASMENSEAIIVSDPNQSEKTESLLEKENNQTDNSKETTEDITISDNVEDHRKITVTSSSNIVKTTAEDKGGVTQKFLPGRVVTTTKLQNVLQRPLSMSNVTSFKRPIISTSVAGSSPKNIVNQSSTRQQPIIVTTTAGTKQNYIKVVTSSQANVQPKTITMAQAQKLGLLTPGRIQQILPTASGNKKIILNQSIVTSPKKVTMVKSPARILPAPPQQQQFVKLGTTGTQRFVLKQNTVQSGKSSGAQIIKIPSSQMAALGIQQIQLPGSNKIQYVRVVQTTNPSSKQLPPIKPRTITIPASSTSSSTNKMISNVISSMSSATTNEGTSNQIKLTSVSNGNIVSSVPSTRILLPANYLTDTKISPEEMISSSSDNSVVHTVKLKQGDSQEASGAVSEKDFDSSSVNSEDVTSMLEMKMTQATRTLEPNGIRPRKPCNCTKSMCLKLYCDCFANGEFCYQCNCNSCFNNIEHEDDRHHAIRQCLERNPNAFRPKIGKCLVGEGERRHTKGCNCKRSGCLKNYCECYEAKIPCSNNCKCVSCRNVEENLFLRLCQSERTDKPADAWKSKLTEDEDHNRLWSTKLAFSFMSESIVTATCHCLFAQAEKAKKSDIEEEELQKIILEECGSCLQQIIGIASKALSHNKGNS